MTHDELLESYRDAILEFDERLSIQLGVIIVINIFALLHKHETITEITDLENNIIWQNPADLGPRTMVILQDFYDTNPDDLNLNEFFLENPDWEKVVKAHFVIEAVDRLLIVLQTALSIFAFIRLIIFNQWSKQFSSARIAVFGVLAVSFISDVLLVFTAFPFTTIFKFFCESLSFDYLIIFVGSKVLALMFMGCGGYNDYKRWSIVKRNARGMHREQVALAEVNVHRGHRELAALGVHDAPRVHREPREQAALAA